MTRRMLLGLFIIIIINSCTSPLVKEPSNNKEIINIYNIEWLSDYVFSLKFNEVSRDSILRSNFIITKNVEEDEGVEWKSYSFRKNNKVVVRVENNWEDSMIVSRITFLGKDFVLNNGVTITTDFLTVKNNINLNNLNQSMDGELSLWDKTDKRIRYEYDVRNNKELYYGIKKIKDVPDTLKMESIVVHNIR